MNKTALQSKTIVIATTHHTPAIELVKQLKKDTNYKWNIEYIAHVFPSETHIRHTVIPELKVNFHELDGGKYDRKYLPNTLRGIPKTITAIFKSFILLKRLKPDIVVSFGGYISVPVIISAYLNKVPSITHEQTLTCSLATRINGYFTDRIALSFPDTLGKFPKNKTTVTGNLIREDIFNTKTASFKNLVSKIKNKPLIYITGGNQGSTVINDSVKKIINLLSEKYTIIHHTGNLDYKKFTPLAKKYSNYYPIDYVGSKDIGWVLNNSSVVIGRSGANFCQEVVALNLNSILIPMPKSQQNEQLLNALWVQKQQPGKTIIINQENLDPKNLYDSILRIEPKVDQAKTRLPGNQKLLQLIHEIV